MMREDNKTEYKREYTADIKKEVIAFANSEGGTIYVGRDDNGQVYPIHSL
jgi:ATP-dependent DNA helicase RecG